MVKAKKITTDLIYSISAVGLMNVVLQFIVYPIINNKVGAATFGEMLFLLGVVNILAPSFGIAVNNTRLLLPEREKAKNGDFISVLLMFSLISALIGIIVSIYRGISFISTCLFIYIIIITMLRNYSCVEFRLTLNYKKQFIFYTILSIAYAIGIFPLLITNKWEIIFILGETAAVVFVLIKGDIFNELRKYSEKRFVIIRNSFTLCVNYLITNLMLNLDRGVLLNFVGNEAVSQYYVLSLLGKTISIISGPLNGILIGYLTKGNEKITYKSFLKAGKILLAAGCFFWTLCTIATPIFIKIMYPNLYTNTVFLNFVVNLSQIIYFLTGILVVIVLTITTPKKVLRNQLIYSTVFICLSVILTNKKGINGFAIAAVIANTLYFVLMYLTGLFALKKGVSIKKSNVF